MEYTDFFFFFSPLDSLFVCFYLVVLSGKMVNVIDGRFMQKWSLCCLSE